MFSRLALRKALSFKSAAPCIIGSVRHTATEGPERDLINFPRRVRPIYPGKVRYLTIPEEWFDFFYKKTGVTGPYMLGFGLTTYVLSKEIWVIEHDFWYVFTFFGIVYLAHKKFGTQLANYVNKELDEIEDSFKEARASEIRCFDDAIKGEEKEQWRADGQHMLIAAKKDNVKVQLEATYRERLMHVYSEVKKRLDYQVEKDRIDKVISQKHMVQWVVSNVLKSISAQQEKESLKKCITDLQALSARV